MKNENMESVIIKHVRIEGVWGKYTIDFLLDRDVNILVGNNGVGKTTILNIIHHICNNTVNDNDIARAFKSAMIEFSEGYKVVVKTNAEGEKSCSWLKNGVDVDRKDIYIVLDAVSTFDNFRFPESISNEIKAIHKDAQSELDLITYFQIDRLYKYLSFVSKASRALNKEGKSDMAEKVYEKYDKMKSLCDELFEDKVWYDDEEDGTIRFQMKDDNEIISIKQLSSGEKQMLILLISTLVQNGRNVIAFWDEPELSLHIAWQQVLIPVMLELNPNIQIIMATHSPSILHDGWEMRPINVNKIKTRE